MNQMNDKIKKIDINELIEAEYNPRQLTKEQHKNISDSIKRFGIVDPILININEKRKNIIIGGHQRVKVAKELGYKELPCVELDLNYDRERELNIRLNKNTGEWNYDVLADLFDIKELTEWGFSENSLTGFKEIDYSILDDIDVQDDIESLKDMSVKAIQIEFKVEDYEKAYKMINALRDKKVYVGGEIIKTLTKLL